MRTQNQSLDVVVLAEFLECIFRRESHHRRRLGSLHH